MSILSNCIKDRTKLDKDLAKFFAAGGRVQEIPSGESRSKKINLVRRNLFFQLHHPKHAKALEMPVTEIRHYSRQPHQMTDETLEKLWNYFRELEAKNLWQGNRVCYEP